MNIEPIRRVPMKTITALLLSALLIACGGGGDNETPTNQPCSPRQANCR